MKKTLVVVILVTVFGLSTVGPALAAEQCLTKVNAVSAKIDGGVYFKFKDGTQVYAGAQSVGLNRAVSVALTALMGNKKVVLILKEGFSCGQNLDQDWEYIKIHDVE